MSKILVTGGAGFIGSHLCERLLAEGNQVVCMDNLFTSTRSNIAQLLNLGLEFWRHDVCDPWHIECDQIYHLACPASPIQYQRNPVRTIKTAFLGTLNALQCARDVGARLLITSTSEIYGDPEIHPQIESYFGNVNPVGSRSCYDDKTELLTEVGWVLFSKLERNIKIATMNELGHVEYHHPDDYIDYVFKGDVIQFKNRKMDIVVTPDHNLYARSKVGKQQFIKAGSIKYAKSWKVPCGAVFSSSDISLKIFPKSLHRLKPEMTSINMDDWLEFLGYYISEGCVYSRKKKKIVRGKSYDVVDYSVLIAQVKSLIRSKMEACFKRLNLKACGKNHHQFRISSKYLYEILKPLGKSHFKKIPREYLNLSPRQSLILLNALIDGDGTRHRTSITYYSMSINLANDVQELALRCGYAASISQSNRGLYHVNIRPSIEANLPFPTKQKYDGHVYCVNVKNHVICVRRNGKAIWCGNCYDEGKRSGESLAYSWATQYGTDVRIARLFNVYGPKLAIDDGRVISNFICQAIRGENLTVYGDGLQTRSLCYISDMIIGLMRLMNIGNQDYLDTVPIVNLGNPDEHTILDIAKDIIASIQCERQLDIIFEPLPQDDPKQRKPDISKAISLLNWKPQISYEQGIEYTVNWFKTKFRTDVALRSEEL